MAAFSSSFLFDSASAAANSINNMCALLEQPNNANNSNTYFSQFYQLADQTLLTHQNLDHSTKTPAFGINDDHGASLFSVTNKNSMDSSSIVTDHDKYEHHHSTEPITQKVLNPMNNKRKSKDGSLANSAQSKDMREVKGNKKQKKVKDVEKMKKKSKDEKKATEEAPEGYIHVRARRGQATDSHSLAERVRRERISERMKLLQALVPGCDKVTGKALMLDEIINYVQSLQNQVEFLSMKLASVNPMFYDFGMDMETFMVRPDNDQNLSSLSSPLPTMQPFSSPTASDYPLVDNSANSLLLFQQDQLPNTLLQGNRQVLWEVVDEQRQRIVNQPGLMNNNNLFSFH